MLKSVSAFSIKLSFYPLVLVVLSACSIPDKHNHPESNTLESNANVQKTQLIYLDETRLNIAKQAVKAKQPAYVKAYENLINNANIALITKVDPVTNKTMLPASGDKHDYYTFSSYHWPDPSKTDGLPWIYKDGELNPLIRDPGNDAARRKNMLKSLNILNLAFYHSGEKKYLNKAKEIVHTWFVNKETKMNPNIDYGQAIPGKSNGTNFAIIDWTNIGRVITTVQLLERNNLWESENKAVMDKWFNDYYRWLTSSEFGILESTRTNNHGTNYDYQVIGLMLYLGKIENAKTQIEQVTTDRIAAHIKLDGSQPHELKRTKSVNYTVNNLWALTRIADLSRRHTDFNLWAYQTKSGVNLKTGFDFVVPYINQQKTWKWKQIVGGGAQPQLKNLALPMFSKTELMLGEKILPVGLNGYKKFTPQDVLTYAPPMNQQP